MSYIFKKISVKSFRSVVIILVAVKVLFHVYVLLFEGYGIFRDELYYLANTAHPAFGYVDHPPFSVWLLDVFTTIFGDSWRMIRVLPAVIGGLTMWGVLQLTRSMGGSLWACWLTGIGFLFAPINNAFASFYSMNSLDLLFWAWAFVVLLKALRKPEETYHWVILGAIVGLGMMNKISMSWFAIGMIIYLVITPSRVLFRRSGPYLAGIAAFAIFSPFIIWNVTHDMAHVEFARNASAIKYAGISRVDFLLEQLMMQHPLVIVFLIVSIFFLFDRKISAVNKAPVIIFFVTLAILLMKGQVKANYMAPAYHAIFASGAVLLGSVNLRRWQRFSIAALATVYVITGIAFIPLSVPILPVKKFIAYNEAFGLNPSNSESKEEGQLPQFFADMHGWENFAKTVSQAYLTLPEEARSGTAVWANNYGEAAAIDYYRDKYPLPDVLSRHNAYYYWGIEQMEDKEYNHLLIIGGSQEEHLQYLESVIPAQVIECTYCMPYENNLTVFIARTPLPGISLKEGFVADKNFN